MVGGVAYEQQNSPYSFSKLGSRQVSTTNILDELRTELKIDSPFYDYDDRAYEEAGKTNGYESERQKVSSDFKQENVIDFAQYAGQVMHTEGDEPLREERLPPNIDDCESFWVKSVLSRIEEENAAPSTIYRFSSDFD